MSVSAFRWNWEANYLRLLNAGNQSQSCQLTKRRLWHAHKQRLVHKNALSGKRGLFVMIALHVSFTSAMITVKDIQNHKLKGIRQKGIQSGFWLNNIEFR